MTSDDANPMGTAQRLSRPELPRRFYKDAGFAPIDGGFVLTLDGRPARTPGKRPLAVATEALAQMMTAEWAVQSDHIDPMTMPVTRIVNVAIDGVAAEMASVREEIVRYAGSDLICYRADGPDELIDRQNEAWSPLVAWARDDLGARLLLAEGVIHVAQEPKALAAVEAALAPLDPLQLAAVHTMTTLTGSAIIALAVLRLRLTAEDAWIAAHVDEDWQMEQWGRDEIALTNRAARWTEMKAAAQILAA
jgi:chaperone required for assembly of F1-ATPase